MTELAHILASLTVGLPLLAAALTWLARTPRQADVIGRTAAVGTAAPALTLATLALTHGGVPLVDGSWLLIDRASGVLLAVTGVIGLSSALVSPAYLRVAERSWLSATASHSWYYSALFAFWAALMAVPVSGNLAVTWLLIEATTAASALLVSFSGRREALEAGWKYLILTTLGLSVALFGIIVIGVAQAGSGHHGLTALDWHALVSAASSMPRTVVISGFVLLIVGLAAKIGWAPVHNWLPDAHSEAPAPVSALLSAVLLPTVLLIAWRVNDALAPGVGRGMAATLFIGFGLASILVAIPFLWKRMPWKRLLAYSSLEHMGIIAVGLGFASPLAIAGVIVHVSGHAVAKSLGFYASLPKRGSDATVEVAGGNGANAVAKGISLVALAGLPPSPLFVSELLIVVGGFAAGYTVADLLTVIALALGFLGLMHAFLEDVVADEPGGLAGREHSSGMAFSGSTS